MLLWSFLFVMPILLLFLYSAGTAAHSYETQMHANIQQILRPFAREIDITLENARRYIAGRHPNLRETIDETDELKTLQKVFELGDSFSEDLVINPQIDAVFWHRQGKIWFVQNYARSYKKQKGVADALTEYLSARDTAMPLFQQGYQCLEVGGVYYFFTGMDWEGGALGFWFSAETLLEPLRKSGIEGLELTMFTDRTGSMLAEPFNTRSRRRLAELLSDYLVVNEPLSSGAFSLTALLNRDAVLAPFTRLYRMIIITLGMACFFFLAFIGFMRSSVILPMHRLIQKVREIQPEQIKPIRVRPDDASEIQEITRVINTMVREADNLKIRVYEDRITQQRTEMQLYQLQLRPHFFLNALNSILNYARADEYALLQRMILGLASHCRYILYSPWFVSVEEELAYAQNYIDMQSMQHNHKYRYQTDVPEDLLDEEIPILAIQIFVENAVKHSRDLAGDTDIFVKLYRIHDAGEPSYMVAIEDTGIGFNRKLLSQINDPSWVSLSRDDHGIGIENVRQRLSILYAGRAVIHFSNREGKGARVTLRLPLQHAPQQALDKDPVRRRAA
jgi:two-component system sensor histidine kinase YesM